MEYSVNSFRKVAIEKKFSELKKITEETTNYVSDPSIDVGDVFRKACSEVLAVLANTKSDIKEEIPISMIEFLEMKKDGQEVSFDNEKDIDELDLSEKASLLIAIIYRSYLCPDKEALDVLLLKNEKKKKKHKMSLADMKSEDIEEYANDKERLRKEYLNGIENFEDLEDYLDDEYEFNKFLDEREEEFTDDLSFKEKVDLKKLDRNTRKRASKELDLFESRLERLDFEKEKSYRKANSLIGRLKAKVKKNKEEDEEE